MIGITYSSAIFMFSTNATFVYWDKNGQIPRLSESFVSAYEIE